MKNHKRLGRNFTLLIKFTFYLNSAKDSVGMCERTSWHDTSSSSNNLHISSQVERLVSSLASVRETEANKIIKYAPKIWF